VRQLGLGLLVGIVLGAAATWGSARLPDAIARFVPVDTASVAALAFGVADVIGGSGFLGVYLVGLAVGSTPSRFRRQLVAFHEWLAFLAQVAMFVVLGLLVFPHRLGSVGLASLALAACGSTVVRPGDRLFVLAPASLRPELEDVFARWRRRV